MSLPFEELESSIEHLIAAYSKLKEENKLLNEQLKKLNGEKDVLLEKNQQAADQIKQIIQRIREEIDE